MTAEEVTMYADRLNYIKGAIEERKKLAEQFQKDSEALLLSEENKTYYLNSSQQLKDVASGMELAMLILFPSA